MKVSAIVQVLGKVQKPWIDNDGNTKTSYAANIMQNNGEIIDTLRLTKEQFDVLEANQTYTIMADYGSGKNGAYLRVAEIIPKKI